MNTPSLVILRGRGRPRSAEPGSSLTTWVPVSHHDRIVRLARANDVSVSRFVATVIDQVVRGKIPTK